MTEMSNAEKLARAVLLFHDAGEWTQAKRDLWEAFTGQKDATTKVLCDLARKVRKEEEERSMTS